ncbi:MAG: hypothetical protein ACLVB5_05720 [Christensenellales bacterium]
MYSEYAAATRNLSPGTVMPVTLQTCFFLRLASAFSFCCGTSADDDDAFEGFTHGIVRHADEGLSQLFITARISKSMPQRAADRR